ncbi:hypothetical protein QTP88_012883 [Uroleucon formosanum]
MRGALFCPGVGKPALKANELQSVVNGIGMRKNFRTNHLIKDPKWISPSLTSGTHEYGVGIILAEKMAKSIKNFIPISSRAILVQLLATPVDVNIIQVYARTADKEDNDIEKFFKALMKL